MSKISAKVRCGGMRKPATKNLHTPQLCHSSAPAPTQPQARELHHLQSTLFHHLLDSTKSGG
jgi:hypothetical protein